MSSDDPTGTAIPQDPPVPTLPSLPAGPNIPATPPSPQLPADPPTASLADCAPCCGFSGNAVVDSIADDHYFSNPIDDWRQRNKGQISVAEPANPDAVVINKTYSLTYQMGANEDDHASRILNAVNAAFSAWQRNASGLRVRVKMTGCPDKDLRIIFKSQVVPVDGDIVIRADNTPQPPNPNDALRSFVRGGTDMTYYLNGSDPWVMIHEIGHTIGLGDEYLYKSPSAVEPVITVFGHDMPDFIMTLPLQGPEVVAAGAAQTYWFERPTVMGQYNNTTFPKYLYYWVAYETARALAGESRLISVTIVNG